MKSFLSRLGSFLLISIFSSITVLCLAYNASSTEELQIAGDSFSQKLFQGYENAYQKQTGEKFKYFISGTLGGIRLFIDKTVDLSATSVVPTPIEKNQIDDGLLMIPTGGGALAIVYNLEDVPRHVDLTREQLAGIFTGTINNWQMIDSSLPNRQIYVVVRSDSSNNSFILTKYIQKITNGMILASRRPQWGFRIYSAFADDNGISGEIKRVDGSIGYVSKYIATSKNLSIARLENKQSRFVEPSLEETKKSLENIKFKDDFSIENIDDPEDGYPLVSLTWLLTRQRYSQDNTLDATKKLLRWIVTQGQNLNEDLGYTKIPESVTKKVLEKIDHQLKIFF